MQLSLIITAHDEGLLAHKTMLSVFQALNKIPSNNQYEIIIHIDNGTPETISYFKRYKKKSNIRIFENQFGDLGASRNFGIKKARGEYIIFMDADDLISEDYIQEMLKLLTSTNKKIMVHPEYSISFWNDASYFVVWHTRDITSREEAARLLFAQNQWPSSCGARKEVFEKYPYVLTKNGYGHEDYIMNINVANAGIEHRVAKNITNFYRQKPQSLMRDNDARHVTQPYSELFDFNKWKNYNFVIDNKMINSKKTPEETLKNIYVKARYNRFLNACILPFATIAKKITGKKLIQNRSTSTKLPDAIMRQWEKIGHIEMNLYPSPDRLKRVTYYSSNTQQKISEAYYRLCQQVTEFPDYVIATSWLMPGGSEKVVLNYLKSIEKAHPDWKVALVTTLPSENIWRNKIPDNTMLIEFGNAFDYEDFSEVDRDFLFNRLMLQLKAKKLHIINSITAYQWVYLHQELVKNEFKIYTSLFCHDYLPGTHAQGYFDYADPFAFQIYQTIEKIYTDNTATVQYLKHLNGFDEKKFKVHYQPVDISRIQHEKNHKLNILWAGRVTTQKNPDLLIRIANKIDPNSTHIDAYGQKDGEYANLELPDNDAFLYHGSFDNIQSLGLHKYDIFLHTSLNDGMPNTILEAAAAGLVVIASNVGGIGDFIHDGETGYLIKDVNNENAYVDAINYVRQHPEKTEQIRANAIELLKHQYSWMAFDKNVSEDIQ